MRLFQRLSFKSKLLFLILAMVIFIGGTMGLLIRTVVFPYLVREIDLRGQNAARRLAENARASILQRDRVRLTAIIFEEKSIDKNISHIVVTDENGKVLAHTFLDAVPPDALHADNGSAELKPAQAGLWSFLTRPLGQSQILLPVFEGLHQIGAIRVGLHPQYMDRLIFELRIYNLVFIGFVMLVGLLFGLYLSRIITRPVLTLTAFAREISLGNLNKRLSLGNRINCKEVLECTQYSCPAYGNQTLRCWFIDGTCMSEGPSNFPDKMETCKSCPVYTETSGDEIIQLADTFNHMTSRLSTSEQELRNSEIRYRWLFNSGPHPVFIVSAETCLIQDANDRAADIYGIEKKRLIGMRFTDLMFEQHREEIRAAFRKSRHASACSLIPKIRHQKREGGLLWVNIYFCPDSHAGKSDLVVTTADISDFIEAETQLIQAGKMATLGEMATGVAHELNQPLNAIKLGSEYLLKMTEKGQPLDREDLDELADDMSREVDRAAGIINHLRQFGRKSEVVAHRVDINKSIRGVFTILGQQLKVHGIEVKLDLDENLPPIMADQNRVEQVFVNLVNNARDAMLDRKTDVHAAPNVLTVRSFSEQGRVTATVSDTGPGIPESIAGRLFEPFFTTKETGKGTGLGLSISYGIVRDYKGTIYFTTSEEAGATFIVSFPEAPGE
ncbi:MAG: ATP-binding protein [Syntrophobacteraceae bacterium]